MEADSLNYRENIRNQIEEAYGKVVYSYVAHIIQANRMRVLRKRLKWAEVICSALPTGSFLLILSEVGSKYSLMASLIGGMCSIVSIILMLYFKDTDREEYETQKRHFDTSNKLWLIREDYLSLLTDFDQLELDEILNKREQLKNLVAKIYTEAPITDNKSYELTRLSLKEGETQFFTQEEINQILPQKLRHC